MTRPLFLALACASAAGAQTGALSTILETGPVDQRINVVVVAEGYTAGQLGQFRADAGSAVALLLDRPPYDAYGGLFNAYAVSVASNQSGADHPSRNEFRDTAFDAYYDCAGIERLVCIGDQPALFGVLAQAFPAYDVLIVLVNDPQYGGSGGQISVASTHPSSAEIVIHEVGHSFAGLADEYGGTGAGFTSVNTSRSAARAALPWSVWVEPATPLPTPQGGAFSGAVGAFLGAAYSDHSAYRPQELCGMRTLATAFCAVCHENHIGAMYRAVSPLGTVEPAGTTVEAAGQPLTFRVAPLVPADRQSVEWRVGGAVVQTGGETLTLAPGDLPQGQSTVEVRVADVTAEVRDPALVPLLSDAHAWTVNRTATDAASGAGATWLGAVGPNPAAGDVRVPFRLAAAGDVRLSVVDVLGREVAVLVDGPLAAGPHSATWAAGRAPAGLYVVRLDALGVRAVRRVTVAR